MWSLCYIADDLLILEQMKNRPSDGLIDELRSRLPRIEEQVYKKFDDEVNFIDIAVQQLDNISCSAGSQSARIQVKELHQSPYVTFDRPEYVPNTNPELGDLLYILNFFESGQVVERRASIAQAKFKKGKHGRRTDRVWKPDLHQFYLLDNLPDFEFVWKDANESFSIEKEKKSLTTYIFASNFLPPFFKTVDRSKWYIYDKESDPTIYTLPRKEPWEVNEYSNQLISMIRRQYGQAFESGGELQRMLRYMFEEQRDATFSSGRSENHLVDDSGDPITDGGRNEASGSPMKVIFIDIGLDTLAIDPDSPEDVELDDPGDLYALGREQLRTVE